MQSEVMSISKCNRNYMQNGCQNIYPSHKEQRSRKELAERITKVFQFAWTPSETELDYIKSDRVSLPQAIKMIEAYEIGIDAEVALELMLKCKNWYQLKSVYNAAHDNQKTIEHYPYFISRSRDFLELSCKHGKLIEAQDIFQDLKRRGCANKSVCEAFILAAYNRGRLDFAHEAIIEKDRLEKKVAEENAKWRQEKYDTAKSYAYSIVTNVYKSTLSFFGYSEGSPAPQNAEPTSSTALQEEKVQTQDVAPKEWSFLDEFDPYYDYDGYWERM